jgi:WD40 repeat protein
LAIVLWEVDGGSVALWDPSSDKLTRLAGYARRSYQTAYSPNGRTIAVGAHHESPDQVQTAHDTDGALSLYDPVGGDRIAALQELPLDVTAVAFSSDGRRVGSAHKGGVVKLWAVEARRPVAVFQAPAGRQVTCLAFSPDDRALAAGADQNTEGRASRGQVLVWAMGP